MATETADKVLVKAKFENLEDLFLVEQGLLPADRVHGIEVSDALVEPGATVLSMPNRLIAQLGLRPVRSQQAWTGAETVMVRTYGTARLTIQGRVCLTDMAELPEDGPVRIDRVTLHLLDFVVDPVGRTLIGNPAHGGEHIIELY
jgi:predicted aspartyl protease